MTKSQQATLDRFKRVQEFFDCHATELSDVNRSRARVQFDETLAGLDRSAAEQVAASVRARSQTALRAEQREELIDSHLRPIVTIVRACLSHLPRFGSLRMPKKHDSDRELVLAAQEVADVVGAERQLFLDEGLPVDFIEQLVEAAGELSELMTARDQGQCETVATTQRVRDLIKAGLERLRLLNALVLMRIRGDEELAAGWRSVCAIRKAAPTGAGCSPARSR